MSTERENRSNYKHVVRFSYDTDTEFAAKMIATLERLGYHPPEKRCTLITVGQLAALVGRPVGSVSRLLHRGKPPSLNVRYGAGTQRRRILAIEPSERLLSWLRL